MEQLDSVLRYVVYVSDCSGNLKGGFVRTLREVSKRTKAVAYLLEERARDQLGKLSVRAERAEIGCLEGVNRELTETCSRLEKRISELESEVGRLRMYPSPISPSGRGGSFRRR